ncbi:MAG: hypothetical protein QXQ91_03370, partial [Nanopusillaceae archaeon]
TSVVTVWRPRDGTATTMVNAVEDARRAVKQALSRSELAGIDLFFEAYTVALSTMTNYNTIELVLGLYAKAEDIVAKAMEVAAEEIVGEHSGKLGPVSLAYALFKKLHPGETPTLMSSREVITLGYGIARRANVKLSRLLLHERLVEPMKTTSGPRVAKQKVFRLLSPTHPTPEAVKEVAGKRRLDLVKLGVIRRRKVERFTNPVDILHVLEYKATQTLEDFARAYRRIEEEYPDLLEEARYLAHTIAQIPGDPEAELAALTLKMIENVQRLRE